VIDRVLGFIVIVACVVFFASFTDVVELKIILGLFGLTFGYLGAWVIVLTGEVVRQRREE